MRTVDLFCGAGGFTDGLRQAGYNTIFANEYDENAHKTFSLNHPTVPIICRNIAQVSVDEVLDITGMKVGDTNLLVGGSPCQGFSTAGRRLVDDPRNQLFLEFVRMVHGIQPEIFVFENVAGILSMNGGKAVSTIVRAFNDIGYKCQFSLLNSADYGVPQSRKRFILIGSRDGHNIGFPTPTHSKISPEALPIDTNIQPYVTVWDAISDLPKFFSGEGFDEMLHSGNYDNEYQIARRGVRAPGMLYNHLCRMHSDLVIERFTSMPVGDDSRDIPIHIRTKKIMIKRLDSKLPSNTITGEFKVDLVHPKIPRSLTAREAARIQSFDDDYRFLGSMSHGSSSNHLSQDGQIGNAVPPLLARAIGTHIKEVMGW